jgi:hypothetical protein
MVRRQPKLFSPRGFSNKSDQQASVSAWDIAVSKWKRRLVFLPRETLGRRLCEFFGWAGYFFGSTVSFMALPTRNLSVVLAGI